MRVRRSVAVGVVALVATLVWALPAQAEAPKGTGAPVLRKAPHSADLTCSQGSWSTGSSGSHDLTYTYRWFLNGSQFPETAPSTEGFNAGSYYCIVTASSSEGSATQKSNTVEIDPASVNFKLARHKLRTRAGGKAVFKVWGTNYGDFPQYGVTICVKGPKRSRRALRMPKCREVTSYEAEATKVVKFALRPRPGARGTYPIRFTVKVRNYEIKPFKAKLVVRR